MHGQETALLTTLVSAATTWRTATINAGGSLTQVNVLFPDGHATTLAWDAEADDWLVTST